MVKKIKPVVFIGCSTENLETAIALQEALDYETEPFVWHQDGFPPSQYPLESLEKHLEMVDVAIFLFAPDDVTQTSRGESRNTVRDNVLFELGLFIGRLSRSRTFIVKPRGVRLDLPSDLYGITPIDYEQDRSDLNLTASLGPAARKILNAIRLLSPRTRASDVALLEAGEDEASTEHSMKANDSSLFTPNASSEWSDFSFAFFMAVIHSDTARQHEIDTAFRESAFGKSKEALAAWEASGLSIV